jgi:hypothetical protein
MNSIKKTRVVFVGRNMLDKNVLTFSTHLRPILGKRFSILCFGISKKIVKELAIQ